MSISYAATTVLRNLSTKRARKGAAALEKAGYGRYNVTIFRELCEAGLVQSRGAGWYIRVA